MRGHRSGACHPSVQLKAKPGPTLGLAKQEELSRYGVPLPLLPALLLTNYRVAGLVQVMTSKVANYVATAVARASPNLHDMYADPPPTRIVRTRMSRPAHYRNYRPATSSESFVTTVQCPRSTGLHIRNPKVGEIQYIITDVSYQSPSVRTPQLNGACQKGRGTESPLSESIITRLAQ